MATSGLDQRFLKQPKPLDEMNLTRSWEDALDLAGGTVVHVSCDFDGCMSCVRTSTVGLGFFLGGPVRDTGIINTGAYDLARAATVAIPCEQVCRMLMGMLAIGIVSVVWTVLGISLAFRDGRDFIGDVDWAMLQGNQQQQQQQLQGNRQQQQQQQGELGGGGDEDKEMCPQQCACGGRGHRAEESLVKQRWKGRRPLSLLDVNLSSAMPKSASFVSLSGFDGVAVNSGMPLHSFTRRPVRGGIKPITLAEVGVRSQLDKEVATGASLASNMSLAQKDRSQTPWRKRGYAQQLQALHQAKEMCWAHCLAPGGK
jgi:hypothetical protein